MPVRRLPMSSRTTGELRAELRMSRHTAGAHTLVAMQLAALVAHPDLYSGPIISK
jgi:hypothetical protein